MDFFQIATRDTKQGVEVYPDFLVGRFKDLMIRSNAFYAIWDEAVGMWSTDEYDVQRLVDEEVRAYAQTLDGSVKVKYLRSGSNKLWAGFKAHVKTLSDNAHQLDENLTFADQVVKRTDYVSRRLPYSLEDGDYSAWDELLDVLYTPEQREKIEWAIGAVVSGDAKKIQKFHVFYGPAGTGKSTVLNVIEKLFEGYTASFNAKDLGVSNNQFATEAFRHNPLVAIQHDGDLSKIEDNTKLNSIISHEPMLMNEKFKATYTAKVNAYLFMGSNMDVKITDSKSGLLRRLIDVHPTGSKLARNHYDALMSKIDFQLGSIAKHCLDVYRKLGKNHYANYRPTEMMLQSNPFFNFVEWHFDLFKAQNGTSLKQAYTLYKEYCADTGVDRPMPQHRFREELRSYFDEFHDRKLIDGAQVRSYYEGFNAEKYKAPSDDGKVFSLVMDETISLFDQEFAEQPAQLASAQGTPKRSWSSVKTTLAEVSTGEVHFVKVPDQLIVIDFDLKDDNGDKSLERNLEEASKWPSTYAEISQSGNGVHLHYFYDGDVSELRKDFADGIEVKVLTGNASLRRRLSKCNSVPIATMRNTLPIKEKKMLGVDVIKSEKSLRAQITRNLNKEIHPGTKPSIDFIKHILDQAYESGLQYDVKDMRPKIIAFANNSTNQSLVCLKIVKEMKFQAKDVVDAPLIEAGLPVKGEKSSDTRRVLFDVEVYPNLFVVCWKYEGDSEVVRMINPSPEMIEGLLRMPLVGYNNRRYDNHILYGRFMGYDNAALYELSQKLINNSVSAYFGEAWNISYADIYDYSSKKQSLKKFMIDLGVNKVEMDIPWDQPVPEDQWERVVDYCVNDVNGTEATMNDREQDFVARQILASLSGLSVNDPTTKHTARIIFGGDRDAQKSFVYTDLRREFPGYDFDRGKSVYVKTVRDAAGNTRDVSENPGEGGYVYAEPGMYQDVAVLDVASMHPTSILALKAFGEYTPNFAALLDARIAIKRRKFDAARVMLGGKLAPFLTDEAQAKQLSYALKIVINIVYGLTAAKFDNPFRIPGNVDNIVAKRGALFMIDLKYAVQEQGFDVVHIKTDSIKIPGATPEIIEFVMQFGAKYGYEFEHENTYDYFCLVNDAVYIAREGDGDDKHFEAVGAQFQHPYVFKALFSEEDISFDDICETKQVKSNMYIDLKNRDKPEPEDLSDMQFIGKIGRFVPVKEEAGIGGTLWRFQDGKYYAVTGTKGYRWVTAKVAEQFANWDNVAMSYFETLAQEARDKIDYYGSFQLFCDG
jgi:hypothetical protein